MKFRLRSEKEIRERLKRKKFEAETVKAVLGFLRENGFVDDRAFAKAWAESRLKKPFGLKRISRELLSKGIPGEIIESRLEEIKKGYSEEGIILNLAKERLKKSGGIDPRKAKQRVYGYLIRRGFSMGKVIEALNQL